LCESENKSDKTELFIIPIPNKPCDYYVSQNIRMNKIMLGIGAVVILAAVLIVSSNVGTPDLVAKSYDQSNAQSAAVSNECPAFQDNDNEGNMAGTNQLAASASNCIGDINMIQDSNGAAIASSPSTAGSAEETGFSPG
jgi:hypothetical protein